MVYTYTPTYYSSLHDSITSICKTILPFSLKKGRLEAAEHKLAKLQSDNLKWQQDSFHQILNLMGLHKEGILEEHEVSAFRSHLLETMVSSPADQDQPAVLKDKLLFLQELLYGKCISEQEYHASKRPILKKLAVQGVEIEAKYVIVGGEQEAKESSDEEWSVIDLKDEKCLLNKEKSNSKHGSAMKQIKGAASVLGFRTPHKPNRSKEEKSIFDSFSVDPKHQSSASSSKNELSCSRENPFWNVHFKEKDSALQPKPVKEASEKAKRKPFRTLFQREGHENGDHGPDSEERAVKTAKKQWGLKKWKRSDSESETAPLPLNERSDSEAYSESVYKTPKCDRYDAAVLEEAKKEITDHEGGMQNLQKNAEESSSLWDTFEDDENCHPNLFAPLKQHMFSPHKLRTEPAFSEDQNQNPFWIPGHHGSS